MTEIQSSPTVQLQYSYNGDGESVTVVGVDFPEPFSGYLEHLNTQAALGGGKFMPLDKHSSTLIFSPFGGISSPEEAFHTVQWLNYELWFAFRGIGITFNVDNYTYAYTPPSNDNVQS